MSKSPLEQPLEVYAPFNVQQSERLRTFVADVEELASSSFFNRSGARVTVQWRPSSGALSTEMDEVSEESVRAVVPICRQLWNHTEPTSMSKSWLYLPTM